MRAKFVALAWLAILFSLIYIYFYHPELYVHLFEYPGAGSPYVDTPQG